MSTPKTTTSLKRYAESQGVEVVERHLPDSWPRALYIPELNTIYLEARQPHCYKRVNLAHELGHAMLGHTRAQTDWWEARQELQADIFAACLLINPDDYARLEVSYDSDASIAEELEVTPYLLEVWKSHTTMPLLLRDTREHLTTNLRELYPAGINHSTLQRMYQCPNI